MGYFFEDKRIATITNAFEKVLDESNRQTSKIWAV